MNQRGVILAAGGLLRRRDAHGVRLAVVRRHRYGDCTLPKGKLDGDETFLEAALREVREETGCEAEALGFAGAIAYEVEGTPKVVLFWHMGLVREGMITAADEVSAVEWLTPDEALAALSHPTERHFLEERLQYVSGR